METGFQFQAPAADRLDKLLVDQSQRSRAFIQSNISSGHVSVNGITVTKCGHRIRPGDRISGVWEEKSTLPLQPIAAPLEVLYEDDALLILNKRAGVVVHPASAHREDTLLHHLLHYLGQSKEPTPPRVGLVHRLDRGTSGVLLIAKTSPVQEALSAQFKDRSVKKEYEALVWGRMGVEGQFDSPVGRDRSQRHRMSSRTHKGRQALTLWRTIFSKNCFSHVALFPHTGRTHQLRVHLSEAGHPVVGDPLYGRKSLEKRLGLLPDDIQMHLRSLDHTLLHSRRIQFLHPLSQKEISIEAPRPREFDSVLKLLQIK